MSEVRVGLIGVGAFGARIARRLLWNGWHQLQLYDVNDISTRQFTQENGGLATGSPRMLAQTCNIVLTALPSALELREVCFGWESLAKGFAAGGIVVDLGMTDPIETVAMAQELKARGIDLVDAPAHGTLGDARDGKLTFVVGGEPAAVERCRPVLAILGQNILLSGATGSAQATRMIVDYMRAVTVLAASEAIRLGEHLGFEPGFVVRMSDELGRAEWNATTVLEQVAGRRFASGIALGLITGNLELAAKLAATYQVQSPLLAATRELWRDAQAQLGSGADYTAVIRWLESLHPMPPAPTTPEPNGESRATPIQTV